jgi:hypothetical protein
VHNTKAYDALVKSLTEGPLGVVEFYASVFT